MFQKEEMIKKTAFVLGDFMSLTLALLISNFIRFGELRLFTFKYLYIHVYFVALAAILLGNMMWQLDRHVFDRGLYQEFVAILKLDSVILIFMMTYLYMMQRGEDYSRGQMILFLFFNAVLGLLFHQIIKSYITKNYHRTRSCRKVMLVTTSDRLEEIMSRFEKTNNWYFELAYVALLDCDRIGEEINGVPIIATLENILEKSKEIALDSVFINASYFPGFDVKWALKEFQGMGAIVHININALDLNASAKVIEKLGDFTVISYANRLRNPMQLILKKVMDKLGALVGLLITALVGIVVIPAIKLESPGPAFFAQTRVGKNGRRFKMYKFRSMYIDAEERKAELMAQNEMKGAMFKMENDPRITKVGKFIRKYSIDELPQFWNVMKGDMSLVGTRPPTVDEVEQYELTQKRRLSVTPGMTGIWQTSGRSEIYDFDQIVKLDLEYIDSWSIALDVKLLIKTVVVCIRGSGAK